jgi:arylsulfatase A-like enzyme
MLNKLMQQILLIVLSIASQILIFSKTTLAQNKKKPNIIFILTDDLGVGDVGVFFQNQRKLANQRNKPFTITPYIDKMAAGGAMLDQYCAAPVCAPSRASILLGQSQGHANVRDNQFDKALADNYTLGNVMQMAGYRTAAIGKWGLQGGQEKTDGIEAWTAFPLKRGFDYYMGYVRHKDGHEHYPKEGLYSGSKKEVYENTKDIGDDLDKCYTGDLFTAVAKKYIVNHTKSKDKNKPFFMYLAYDTPHAVLQLPTQAYPSGYGLKGGIQWTGIKGAMINTASGTPDSWLDPEYANATYDHDDNAATAEKPWPNVYKRYATVTKRIDNQVNDVLELLEDLGIADNTLVVFTSDNGPSIESYLKNQPFESNFFESFGKFDGIKRDVLEGGVRTPTLAYWPNHIKPNQQIKSPSISYDWMPTFLEAAGFSAPIKSDGVSLLPQLLGYPIQQKSKIYIEYFNNTKTPTYQEFDVSHRGIDRGQMQMLRLADTVALRYNIKNNEDDFEIYNINKDPKQSNNLAKSEDLTALQKYLKGRVLQMRKADESAKRPYDNALIPALAVKPNTKGWQLKTYNNSEFWITEPKAEKVTSKVEDLNLDKIKTNAGLFEGYIFVPEDGNYTFNLKANCHVFLRIHDIAVIDADYHYNGLAKSETLNLAKGYHQIKLYFKKSDTKKAPAIEFTWQSNGNLLKTVSNNIYH